MSLQAELDVVQQQIGDEKQKGAEKDASRIAVLEQQEAAILLQMDEEAKSQKEQAIEQKVQEDIPFSIPGVDISDVPPEWMQVFDLIQRADRRRIYGGHAVELEQIENDHAEYKAQAELRIANQGETIETLRLDCEAIAAERNEKQNEIVRLEGENNQLALEKAHADAKRDAAVRDKEESVKLMVEEVASRQNEIQRLRSEVADYQKAKVFGERQSQSIIEVDSEEANAINQAIAKATKDTLADKVNRGLARWDLPAITPPPVETVSQFQDIPTTEPTNDTIPAAEAPTLDLPSQFQGEDARVELAVPTPGEQTEVSRQEFEALKAKVDTLWGKHQQPNAGQNPAA